jgi:hypothetical protein
MLEVEASRVLFGAKKDGQNHARWSFDDAISLALLAIISLSQPLGLLSIIYPDFRRVNFTTSDPIKKNHLAA